MNAIQNIARQMNRVLIIAGVSGLALAAGSAAQAQTVRTQKSTYAPNEKIVVEYAGLPGNQSDWITIVKADASDGSYGPYYYTDGKRNGSFTFDTLPAGQYQARLFFNWAGGGGYTVQARTSFTVGASTNPGGNTSTTTTAANFHAEWATNLFDVYLGIVQTTEAGQQVARLYYWWGDWYYLGVGTVTGRVLSGQLDASVGGGTFKLTMAPDGQGFDGEATALWGYAQISFKAGLYARWQ